MGSPAPVRASSSSCAVPAREDTQRQACAGGRLQPQVPGLDLTGPAAERETEAAGEAILAQMLGVSGEQEEPIRGEDRAAIGQERVQIDVQAPAPAGCAVAVRGRVEHDPVVPTAPAALT